MEHEMEAEELLGRIGRVDPPPFLFTRIQARLQRPSLTARWLAVAALTCTLVIAVNVAALRRHTRRIDLQELTAAMGMNPSNQLYR